MSIFFNVYYTKDRDLYELKTGKWFQKIFLGFLPLETWELRYILPFSSNFIFSLSQNCLFLVLDGSDTEQCDFLTECNTIYCGLKECSSRFQVGASQRTVVWTKADRAELAQKMQQLVKLDPGPDLDPDPDLDLEPDSDPGPNPDPW